MIKIRMDMPKDCDGCVGCPFHHWITEDEGEYDICGISGKDIPNNISNHPFPHTKKRMDDCLIEWNEE